MVGGTCLIKENIMSEKRIKNESTWALNYNTLYCRKCKIFFLEKYGCGSEICILVKTEKCEKCGGNLSIRNKKLNRKFNLETPKEYKKKEYKKE